MFEIKPGSILGDCHQVEALLGEGGFGVVTKCRNTETNRMVAIKVNKPHPEIVRQTREEIAILKRLECLDPDTCNIVRWNGFFFNRDHICLNFELLDQSLFDYMKQRHNRGLTVEEITPVIHQLATALTHLKSLRIVHADLKPDNIMVVNCQQLPLKVKIIDFGLACDVSAAEPGMCVQTVWYRAPEVMLHMPFNEAIDMWSLGLVAAELAAGYPLYTGETDYDVMSFIMQTQGQPEDYILDCGRGTDYYFHKKPNSQRMWTFKTPEEFSYDTGVYAEETRFFQMESLDELEQIMIRHNGHHSGQHLLVDLVKKMMHLDPDQRIQPLEVLRHPLFNTSIPQSSTPPHIIIDMGSEEDEPQVIRPSSSSQPSRPESSLHLCRTTTATDSFSPEPDLSQNDPTKLEDDDLEEADIQPHAQVTDSWCRCLFRWIIWPFHRKQN